MTLFKVTLLKRLTISLRAVPGTIFSLAAWESDTLDGGTGTDTAVFNFKRSDATISHDDAGRTFVDTKNGIHDVLLNIERLQFTDGTVNNADAVHVSDAFRFLILMTGAISLQLVSSKEIQSWQPVPT